MTWGSGCSRSVDGARLCVCAEINKSSPLPTVVHPPGCHRANSRMLGRYRSLRPHGSIRLRPPACTDIGFKPPRRGPVPAAVRSQSPVLASEMASQNVRFRNTLLSVRVCPSSSATVLLSSHTSTPAFVCVCPCLSALSSKPSFAYVTTGSPH